MAFVVCPTEVKDWPLHEGIEGKVVVNCQNLTALMATWAPKTQFAVHIHPHEQIGICHEGEAIFTIDGKELSVRRGDVYHIPSNGPQPERNDGDDQAVFIECFSPIREDLLK